MAERYQIDVGITTKPTAGGGNSQANRQLGEQVAQARRAESAQRDPVSKKSQGSINESAARALSRLEKTIPALTKAVQALTKQVQSSNTTARMSAMRGGGGFGGGGGGVTGAGTRNVGVGRIGGAIPIVGAAVAATGFLMSKVMQIGRAYLNTMTQQLKSAGVAGAFKGGSWGYFGSAEMGEYARARRMASGEKLGGEFTGDYYARMRDSGRYGSGIRIGTRTESRVGGGRTQAHVDRDQAAANRAYNAAMKRDAPRQARFVRDALGFANIGEWEQRNPRPEGNMMSTDPQVSGRWEAWNRRRSIAENNVRNAQNIAATSFLPQDVRNARNRAATIEGPRGGTRQNVQVPVYAPSLPVMYGKMFGLGAGELGKMRGTFEAMGGDKSMGRTIGQLVSNRGISGGVETAMNMIRDNLEEAVREGINNSKMAEDMAKELSMMARFTPNQRLSSGISLQKNLMGIQSGLAAGQGFDSIGGFEMWRAGKEVLGRAISSKGQLAQQLQKEGIISKQTLDTGKISGAEEEFAISYLQQSRNQDIRQQMLRNVFMPYTKGAGTDEEKRALAFKVWGNNALGFKATEMMSAWGVATGKPMPAQPEMEAGRKDATLQFAAAQRRGQTAEVYAAKAIQYAPEARLLGIGASAARAVAVYEEAMTNLAANVSGPVTAAIDGMVVVMQSFAGVMNDTMNIIRQAVDFTRNMPRANNPLEFFFGVNRIPGRSG